MTGAGPRILIVDDIDDNRYTLSRRLNKQGYANIDTAENGLEALEKLAAEPFDLVLLDIMMPQMDGYEVLERLKAEGRLADLPVIMISALTEIDSIVRCIKLGAEDYLPKPFNATLLKARIGAVLEKKALRDDLRRSHERMRRELDAARLLQMGMVPTDFPEPTAARPVELAARMVPAREVGGDFYDFFFPDDATLCFVLGDVSDKGTPAALFMARTRSLVRMSMDLWQAATGELPGPAQTLAMVNRELCQNNRERMFVTVFLGVLDLGSGRLIYANAGHPAPYVLNPAGGAVTLDAPPKAPLGVSARVAYADHARALAPGESVFVFSDGVMDATDTAEAFFGTERLEEILRASGISGAGGVLEAVNAGISGFAAGAEPFDDITMLALRWMPV